MRNLFALAVLVHCGVLVVVTHGDQADPKASTTTATASTSTSRARRSSTNADNALTDRHQHLELKTSNVKVGEDGLSASATTMNDAESAWQRETHVDHEAAAAEVFPIHHEGSVGGRPIPREHHHSVHWRPPPGPEYHPVPQFHYTPTPAPPRSAYDYTHASQQHPATITSDKQQKQQQQQQQQQQPQQHAGIYVHDPRSVDLRANYDKAMYYGQHLYSDGCGCIPYRYA